MVTGPIYDEDIQRLSTGVEVADKFFKIVIDEASGAPRAQAFVIRQDQISGCRLAIYLTSINEVEKVIGFDFFRELPDEIEDELEMKISPDLWTSDC